MKIEDIVEMLPFAGGKKRASDHPMSDDQLSSKHYWVHWAYVSDDETIRVKGAIHSPNERCSVEFAIGKTRDDYSFWRWLMERPDYQRIVNEDELNAAKELFALESGLD